MCNLVLQKEEADMEKVVMMSVKMSSTRSKYHYLQETSGMQQISYFQ